MACPPFRICDNPSSSSDSTLYVMVEASRRLYRLNRARDIEQCVICCRHNRMFICILGALLPPKGWVRTTPTPSHARVMLHVKYIAWNLRELMCMDIAKCSCLPLANLFVTLTARLKCSAICVLESRYSCGCLVIYFKKHFGVGLMKIQIENRIVNFGGV